MEPADLGLREILYEFRPWGRTVRVAAIDPVSGTEVVIVGDPTRGEAVLKDIERKVKKAVPQVTEIFVHPTS